MSTIKEKTLKERRKIFESCYLLEGENPMAYDNAIENTVKNAEVIELLESI